VFSGGVLPSQAFTSYLTTAEVAARLRISDRRVRDLIKRGRLAAFKKGKSYLIHKDAFYAFASVPRRPGRPKPGATLEMLRVTSGATIRAIQNGEDGPTPLTEETGETQGEQLLEGTAKGSDEAPAPDLEGR
jgi:excisionase family DNA binding protein